MPAPFKVTEKLLSYIFHNFQNKEKLSGELLSKIKPSVLVTDNSEERELFSALSQAKH